MEENKGRPGWTEYFLEIARAVSGNVRGLSAVGGQALDVSAADVRRDYRQG